MDPFEAEVAREDLHLARACLLLSMDVRDHVDVDTYLARFDPWVDRVKALAEEEGFPAALRHVLADEEGFIGNAGDYYDAENSFLDAVLDRRTGLPITLSIVYLEVARRLGQPLVAVGMPGHFLVRHEETLIDPFAGGTTLTEADAKALLDRLSGGEVRFRRDMLAPTMDRDVLARVLANLKNVYVRNGEALKALWVENRILQVNPFAFPEYRDRGLLKRAVGDLEGAREDLARYVDAMPKAPDAARVKQVLERL